MERRRIGVLTVALGTASTLALGVVAGPWWTPRADSSATEWSAARLGGPSTILQPVLSPDGQLMASGVVRKLVDQNPSDFHFRLKPEATP